MAWSSAESVSTTSPMIHLLTALVAAGAASDWLAPMPLLWQKRAAFHSLVAKLRYPSTRFSSIFTSRPWLSIAAMKKRSASAPYLSIRPSGSTTLPLDLDIFWPSAARTSPCRYSRGQGFCPVIAAPIISIRASQKNRMSKPEIRTSFG